MPTWKQIHLALFALLLGSSAQGRVDRIEVLSRVALLAGQSFGLAGSYEKIIARVHFKVRPENAHNRQIVDLGKAVRDGSGEVEFSADLYLLKPIDSKRGNGALLLEIPNRGGKGMLRIINRGSASTDPSSEAEVGDGFLMRQGFTLAWLGWQFDVRPERGLMRLEAPIARGADGPLKGLVRADFVVPAKVADHPLGHWISGRIGGKSYPVADPSSGRNALTVRDSPNGERKIVPRSRWSFARESEGKLIDDPSFLHLEGGFEPWKIYEAVYEAKDPVVAGLGLAAVRDLISHLKYDAGAPAPVQRAYAIGISQSGRFLRHFLYQDFNADERGRQVLDGVIAHVAGAGRGSFNHRFAQPSRDGQPMSSLFYPTDLFPFADRPLKNPADGTVDGLLELARASRTLPKIFFTNTSYEYWSSAASLIHTTPEGKADLEPMDNVRIYFLAGLQHFSGPFPPAHGDQPDLRGQHRQNPNPITWFWRALLINLDDWVRDGTLPPPSSYPRIGDETLVALPSLHFPKLPGVSVPGTVLQAYALDFGPQFKMGIVAREPPGVGKAFSTLVPQVDRDGNDLGGVRLPELAVPLATYTGWNLRDPKMGAPSERISFIGSYLPFAKTRAARLSAGDPRLSIEERYPGREDYLGRFAAAGLSLVKARWLRAEDLSLVLERAGQEWDEALK
jgi:hypothetical protein